MPVQHLVCTANSSCASTPAVTHVQGYRICGAHDDLHVIQIYTLVMLAAGRWCTAT